MQRAIVALLLLTVLVRAPAPAAGTQPDADDAALGLANLHAQVILDLETGTGSVDAGVVAAQLTWAPERVEHEAGALGFVLAKEQDFTFSCGGVRKVHITERTDYVLDYLEQRDNDGDLQAFRLDGPGHVVGRPVVPRAGDDCASGAWSASPQVWASMAEADPQYRLYVAYRGVEILLWPGSGPGILREPVDEWREESGDSQG